MKKLSELDPQAALELDFEFFLMAPKPLADDATEADRDAFNAQLNTAMAVCDEKVKQHLEKINHS